MSLQNVAIIVTTSAFLGSCTTAIPLVRDVDFVVSSAVLSHGYPPKEWVEFMKDIEPDNVIYVDGADIGLKCGNLLAAECFKHYPDGSTEYILPVCNYGSSWYCDVLHEHAMGHHYQYLHGMPLDHKGWNRFAQ